jgi:small-conductance mechanosensitive channel/CRP-like cAMP-binding protein
MQGFSERFGRNAAIAAVLGTVLLLDNLFTRPLAFVSGISEASLVQFITGGFMFVATLMAARFVREDIIHGMLERRSGKQIPQLVGDLTGVLVIFIGICVILAVVFKRDITALVATGGASVMVIGLALRDMLLAAFTGVLLNIEKPLKPGDLVRINDKWQGKVVKTTWRATTLQTAAGNIILPNLSLANAVILNMAALEGGRSTRFVEVVIDYDTSVESAERILYAAALGAGVPQVAPPTVFARKMERDGVLYEVGVTIANYADFKKAEHAIIKNILQRMRDAGVTVSFPKSEIIHTPQRARIADRSMDTLRLVQQCRVFRGLPEEVCRRITTLLVDRHYAAGATIVNAGERRYSLFIIGEGMAKRTMTDRDGAKLVDERFIATEAFGRRALFGCQAQDAKVVAETAVLAYELDRRALARLLDEDPALIDVLARSLALLSWRESKEGASGREPEPAVIDRLTHLHRGQIEAAYRAEAPASLPSPVSAPAA